MASVRYWGQQIIRWVGWRKRKVWANPLFTNMVIAIWVSIFGWSFINVIIADLYRQLVITLRLSTAVMVSSSPVWKNTRNMITSINALESLPLLTFAARSIVLRPLRKEMLLPAIRYTNSRDTNTTCTIPPLIFGSLSRRYSSTVAWSESKYPCTKNAEELDLLALRHFHISYHR